MYTISAKLTFWIPDSYSLKDKRRIARSLIERTRNRFNASVAEVDTQDIHRTLTVGVAVVSGNAARAKDYMDDIIRYMEGNSDAELTNIELYQ